MGREEAEARYPITPMVSRIVDTHQRIRSDLEVLGKSDDVNEIRTVVDDLPELLKEHFRDEEKPGGLFDELESLRPVFDSQSFRVPVMDPLTNHVPSGLTAIDSTRWPCRSRRSPSMSTQRSDPCLETRRSWEGGAAKFASSQAASSARAHKAPSNSKGMATSMATRRMVSSNRGSGNSQ